MKRKIINFFKSHGILIAPEAVEHIIAKPDPQGYAEQLLHSIKEYPLMLTLESILKLELSIKDGGAEQQQLQSLEIFGEQKTFQPIEDAAKYGALAVHRGKKKELQPEMQLVQTADTYASSESPIALRYLMASKCTGTLAEFTEYFNNRFQTLKSILKTRPELDGAIPLSRLSAVSGQQKIIGMVIAVRDTKRGHRLIELEDEQNTITVFIPYGSPLMKEVVLEDEVIGVIGKLSSRSDTLFTAEKLIRPDVPTPVLQNRSEKPVAVAFISDLHVGSNNFLSDAWERFMRWLGSNEPAAQMVGYIVIAGDSVDGIGVYPGQENDLAITDIYQQYRQLTKLLSEIPSRIRIIIAPGNHDAVRLAEPQPALPECIRQYFAAMKNITFVGSPCYLTLNGVRILIYHGQSLDDFVTRIPNLSYSATLAAMCEMLRRRHLAPIFGGKTPIAPEPTDYLVIDSLPDIFVVGHSHSAGTYSYRGITFINSSCWQRQTPYQLMQNFSPEPGVVTVAELHTGKTYPLNFF